MRLLFNCSHSSVIKSQVLEQSAPMSRITSSPLLSTTLRKECNTTISNGDAQYTAKTEAAEKPKQATSFAVV